ncbi:MAG: DUF58 domain-containing protein [Acidobacteria bacterium]|nr:DUF58 domain-containing protein [Acidobacteriota bacterium]
MKKTAAHSFHRTAGRASGQTAGPSRWRVLLQDALNEMDRPGWKKFMLSMLALALAFLLAVYSSIFAQQGNVLATGICASLALGLSGYVALTAVPYLARRTRLEWLRVSMDYKLTREGYVFIALIFVLAIAGLNTGNNLLYLILSSMLAAILMSGFLSISVLSGVELEVLLPDHVFARRPVPARIHLRNDKKRMPSFSITLSGFGSDIEGVSTRPKKKRSIWKLAVKLILVGMLIGVPAALVLTGLILVATELYGINARELGPVLFALIVVIAYSGVALYRKRESRRGKGQGERKAAAPAPENDPGRNEPAERRILRQPLYFPFLPGGGKVSRAEELEFPRRGLYREDGFTLSTRFPFGFLEKKLRLPVRRDLWVYPAVTPTEEFYEILPMLSGEIEAFQKGRGHDLYSIRDMQPTDSARHVDWKASARTGVPKVREFAREDERRLQLILDRRIGKTNARNQSLFEAAVEFCACLAWHFHEVDAQIQFRCGHFETPPAGAGEVIYDILRHLAEVEPSSEEPLSPLEMGSEENVFRIVCTALPRGSVPTPLWSRSYYVFFDALRPLDESSPSTTRSSPDGAAGWAGALRSPSGS